MRGNILTRARKRFISSLSKSLILLIAAGIFGSDVLLKLTGATRLWFIAAAVVVALALFGVGFWSAVEED